jgi:hypothetical protein
MDAARPNPAFTGFMLVSGVIGNALSPIGRHIRGMRMDHDACMEIVIAMKKSVKTFGFRQIGYP